MDELSHLPSQMQGHLLRVLESSLDVKNREQFFLWVQGQLQVLIPHELMLCTALDSNHKLAHADCMQGVPLEAAVLSELTDPEQGLNIRLARRCREQGVLTLELDPDRPDAAHCCADLALEWAGLNLGPALFLGTGPLAGGVSSSFLLLRMQFVLEPSHVLLMQMLLAPLHMALSRVQHSLFDDATLLTMQTDEWSLTDRQLEVLHWVKSGKTNFEIALILDISALTVKNHMQKLFKRLQVHNRAQAVAKTMALPMQARGRID
ncbi:MAG: helix-turn-helix transcriptional regulator [Polaromonas sp.]|nr:helix-turn-helix transcriptional regulator [Polaromonas sp.]